MSSLSRDDSELTFLKRQKELKEVCHNFKQFLSDIKSFSQQSDITSNLSPDADQIRNSPKENYFSNKKMNKKVNNSNHIDIFDFKNDEIDVNEEEEEEFPDPEKTAIITESCQLHAIIRELYSIKYELVNLGLQLKHINGKGSLTAQKLHKKINEIAQVISKNISRSELLLAELYL